MSRVWICMKIDVWLIVRWVICTGELFIPSCVLRLSFESESIFQCHISCTIVILCSIVPLLIEHRHARTSYPIGKTISLALTCWLKILKVVPIVEMCYWIPNGNRKTAKWGIWIPLFLPLHMNLLLRSRTTENCTQTHWFPIDRSRTTSPRLPMNIALGIPLWFKYFNFTISTTTENCINLLYLRQCTMLRHRVYFAIPLFSFYSNSLLLWVMHYYVFPSIKWDLSLYLSLNILSTNCTQHRWDRNKKIGRNSQKPIRRIFWNHLGRHTQHATTWIADKIRLSIKKSRQWVSLAHRKEILLQKVIDTVGVKNHLTFMILLQSSASKVNIWT